MNQPITPLVAGLLATLTLPVALAQAPPPAAPAIAAVAPQEWIIYDDRTYTPVLDDVSRHLAKARRLVDAKDVHGAAVELRAVAVQISAQSAAAAGMDAVRADEDDDAPDADQRGLHQDSGRRMAATAATLDAAADALDAGRITTRAQLDRALDTAVRSDLDRRWLVADTTTWYPVVQEPQRHFTAAVADLASHDYRASATDIRKADGYLRLEAGRATGAARLSLDNSVARLDKLAASVEAGTDTDARDLQRAFAAADHALAQAYHDKAAGSWVRRDYDRTGYALRAAAQSLESAADWAGDKARSGAADTVTDTRALADKLAAGAGWTRDEVAAGLKHLGTGIDDMGKQLNPKTAAAGKDVPVAASH